MTFRTTVLGKYIQKLYTATGFWLFSPFWLQNSNKHTFEIREFFIHDHRLYTIAFSTNYHIIFYKKSPTSVLKFIYPLVLKLRKCSKLQHMFFLILRWSLANWIITKADEYVEYRTPRTMGSRGHSGATPSWYHEEHVVKIWAFQKYRNK